jgi:hypothetical protein
LAPLISNVEESQNNGETGDGLAGEKREKNFGLNRDRKGKLVM